MSEYDCGCGKDKEIDFLATENKRLTLEVGRLKQVNFLLKVCESLAAKFNAENERLRGEIDKTVCAISDMTESSDFDCGNVRTYLDRVYTRLKEALSHETEKA